jgi:hypothetical protein|tara:strand:- start:76 stop:366 length:291 start_codon:yes stop_codon:yes gene_type:complete
MARMIPSEVSETTQSYAERLMFEKISAELPDDWIALHSLGVAECSGMPWNYTLVALISRMISTCQYVPHHLTVLKFVMGWTNGACPTEPEHFPVCY